MFEDIFSRKKANKDKLYAYGFRERNADMYYDTDITGEKFTLTVTVNAIGNVDTKLVEKDDGEEYILYKTSAVGAYVGEVRAAVERVLADIASHCFETAIFKCEQTYRVINHVQEKYGTELEFLWEKFPDNAIFRRKDNQKWYAAILTAQRSKFGAKGDGKAEIIDLRYKPENMEALLTQSGYYPGWHMSKKSWYTVILDGSLADDELFARIDESFELAAKAK